MGNVRHILLRSNICDRPFDDLLVTLAATQASNRYGWVIDGGDKIFRDFLGATEFCFGECFAYGFLRVAEVAKELEIVLCGCFKDKPRIDCSVWIDFSGTGFVRR